VSAPTTGRFEMKYALPLEQRTVLLEEALQHIGPDENAASFADALPEVAATGVCEPRGYRVSSLYFDDDALSGYSSRIDGRRIRNRVRIRTYGDIGQSRPVFLEAKRKLFKRVVKHRVAATTTDQWAELPGPRPWCNLAPLSHPMKQRRLERWIDVVEKNGLHPVCRVEYWRETFAFERLRLTLDYRVGAEPTLDPYALRGDCSVPLIPRDWMILELKYNNQPPLWMRKLVSSHGLVAEPVSKFALGVARTQRRDFIADQRATTPPSIRQMKRRQGAAK